jgi:hypothetical protein
MSAGVAFPPEVVEAIKYRDGFACVICNATLNLTIHHRRYDFVENEVPQAHDGALLCATCNTAVALVRKMLATSSGRRAIVFWESNGR